MISAFYVARGVPAWHQAVGSIGTLARYLICPTVLMSDQDGAGLSAANVELKPLYDLLPDCDPGGRMAKIRLLDFTPPDSTHVLYLDADTRIIGHLPAVYMASKGGFDLAICPSEQQGPELMWHISEAERAQTLIELGDPEPLQLQGGIFLIARNERTVEFCRVWLEEWQRWRGPDQAALLRALHRVPLKLWLLGRAFNGGDVIQHRFGMARDEKTR